MALSQRLEFRQSQALVMTPQLMQAIKLLQLSNLDLAAYVEGELERNPLLERSTEAPDPEDSEPERHDGSTSAEAAEPGWKAESQAPDSEPEDRNEGPAEADERQ